MPTPNMNEDHAAFMRRCMGDNEANNSFPKEDQRYAFCSSQWMKKSSETGLIKKVSNLKALDIDTKTKRVKIAISQMDSVDKDKDIFDKSAWNKTIKENGPQGTNEIWHLLDHTPRSFSALSKFSELGIEGKYLTGVSVYKNSFAWREVAWPLYEAGDITQHSVGFETLDATERDNKGIRIIKSARLYEGSAVLWGAQPDTPTMAVVKSIMNMEEDRDITAAEKIDEILKKLGRKGFNDEDYSLFIIELKRLQKLFDAGRIVEIFKEPDETTPEEKEEVQETTEPPKNILPDVVQCPGCHKPTYNTQESKGYIRCHRCKTVFTYGGNLFITL